MERRDALKSLAALSGLSLLGEPVFPWAPPRFRIGAFDASIGYSADVRALERAHAIGLDGVQVNLGSAANDMHLRRPDVQQGYRDAVERYGVAVGGLALGELNRVPYKSDPRAEQWVADSIEVARALDCSVVMLAFFNEGDIKDDPAGRQVVVERLRRVAPKAEAAGVVLGIESWLSAEALLRLVDAVGSPAVRVFYDVANAEKMGYDLYAEIRRLGRAYLCGFHMKENGALLGRGRVDFDRVREAIEDIGYTGWMHLEGGVPEGADVVESYRHNLRFLRGLFSA